MWREKENCGNEQGGRCAPQGKQNSTSGISSGDEEAPGTEGNGEPEGEVSFLTQIKPFLNPEMGQLTGVLKTFIPFQPRLKVETTHTRVR